MLAVIAAKLALICYFGTEQPFLDQWVAIGVGYVRGPLYVHNPLESFFWLHGEHRPLWSRLWSLLLLRANGGQWDCFVELTANVLIAAAMAAVFWQILAKVIEQREALAVAVPAGVILLSLPGNFENCLWGFQSCFLFLMLAGMTHVAGAAVARPFSRVWWFAQFAGLAAVFTIAAGMMSAVAVALISARRLMADPRNRGYWATLLLNLAVAGAGYALLPGSPPAEDAGHRLVSLWERTQVLLAWPYVQSGMCWVLYAPMLALTIAWLRGYSRSEPDHLVVGFGMWVVLIAGAIAYGRAVTAETIGVRYYDVLCLGLAANLLAFFRLLPALRGRLWIPGATALAVWLALVGVGLWRHNNPANLFPLLAHERAVAIEQRGVIARFIQHQDTTELTEFAARTHRFTHLSMTIDLLRDAKVHPFLPREMVPANPPGPLVGPTRAVASAWWIFAAMASVLLGWGMFDLIRPARASSR